MSMIMIEGFEQISTSINMTAEQLQYLFLATEPDITAGWFGSAGDSVQHRTGGRVAGNCLRFTRGTTDTPSWAADTGANLGFSFIPKQRVIVGWAARYSEAPTTPIPLVSFRYDSGQGDMEQISLWATIDAKLYISTTPYSAEFAGISTGINPAAVTPSGVFRFTEWTYFELAVNYGDDVPRVSVLVNGEIILDGLESESFAQVIDDPYISSVHFLNPVNRHFGNDSFWQEIDDIYVDDTSVRGPQWIVGLTNGSVVTNDGWGGVPSTNYPGLATDGENFGDYITWNLSDFPAGVGTITAIGVNLIGSQVLTIDSVEFGVCNASDAGVRTKKGSISAGDPDRLLRYCTTSPPATMSMTAASLNNMRGFLRAAQVVV